LSRNVPKNVTPEDADAVADALFKVVDVLADAVAGRVANRMNALSRPAEKSGPRLLTYAQAGERIGRTSEAIKQMVKRKELKAVHPQGGQRAFIYERDLEDYIESGRFGSGRRTRSR